MSRVQNRARRVRVLACTPLFALVVQRLGGVSLFDKGAWDGLQTDIFMLLPERLLALHGNFTCLFPGLGQTSNV